MPNPHNLEAIKQAERLFWEQTYHAAIGINHDLEGGKAGYILCPHYADLASNSVEQWRKLFAPDRVGQPITGEF
jgi:hypothetical protein